MAKPTIPQQIGEAQILKLIEQHQPISIHALYKKSDYGSYSGMRDCVERLEKKELITIDKVKVDKYVKIVRLIENGF